MLLCCKHSLRPNLQNCVCTAWSNYKVFGVWYRGVSGLSPDVWSETCRVDPGSSPPHRVLSEGQQAPTAGRLCGSEVSKNPSARTSQTFHSVAASPPLGLARSAAALPHGLPTPHLEASLAFLGRYSSHGSIASGSARQAVSPSAEGLQAPGKPAAAGEAGSREWNFSTVNLLLPSRTESDFSRSQLPPSRWLNTIHWSGIS